MRADILRGRRLLFLSNESDRDRDCLRGLPEPGEAGEAEEAGELREYKIGVDMLGETTAASTWICWFTACLVKTGEPTIVCCCSRTLLEATQFLRCSVCKVHSSLYGP